ncbi:GNAT family N-acetyltransferase [Nakamurella aerolata]|uniref:GNAT family N-acetyltransferase n=1 Tax=Nakamurella aerolata TaxID=1656892 RepID=A0A849ACH2_9ACTN|nr:GNAT family N-acetyltransferase [Nakamurella aerolata]NNG36871.1 GNAT family N-acetyltransferase [Nakamurella aerolata]
MTDSTTPRLRVEPATGDRWTDLEELFPASGFNGCWCQYWLLGAQYHRRPHAENRDALREQLGSGSAGLLAYLDNRPVGWARLSPRSELPWLARRFGRLDVSEPDVWSLPCFVVASNARRQGVMTALIGHATAWARATGAVLEAYPIDDAAPGATRNRFTGVLKAFERQGFSVVDRLSDDRPVVQYRG